VVLVAVGFHDQPPVAPEEVDQERVDSDVDLWDWKSMALAEPKKQMLQLAPGSVGFPLSVDAQTENASLPDRLPQLLLGNSPLPPPRRCVAHIADRAGWGGNRDAYAFCDVAGHERPGAVQADAAAPIPAPGAGD
jgi:hypothetical protein